MNESLEKIKKGEKISISFSIIILILVLLITFLLRYDLAMRHYIWPWDEAFHALIAKNLENNLFEPYLYPKDSPIEQEYVNKGHNDWTKSYIWLHKPPMSMWFISICFRLFGEDEFIIRLPSLLMSLIGVILVFVLGNILFDNISALMAAGLFAINPYLILLSVGLVPTDHVDITLLFFELLVILFYIFYKRNKKLLFLICSGVCFGLALLSKSVAALIVMVILFTFELFYQKKASKTILYIFLIGFLISCPWFLYTYLKWPKEFIYTSIRNFKHINSVLDGHNHDILFYLKIIPEMFGSVIYLFFIPLGLYLLYEKRQLRLFWLFLCWIIVPMLFFSIAKTKLPGHVLIVYPAICLVISYILHDLLNQKMKIFYKISVILAYALLLVQTVIAINKIAINGNIGFLRTSHYYFITNLSYDYDSFREKMLEIGAKKEKAIIFNVKNFRYIQAMYYSGYPAYDFLPEENIINKLNKQGYKIYVVINKYFDNLAEVRNFNNVIRRNKINVEYLYLKPNDSAKRYI